MKKWLWILLFSLLGIGLVLFAVGYYFYVPPIPPEVLNKKYGVKPTDYIEVNGMDIHYRVEGLASDTMPLVLLHGTSSSLFTWNAWTELLKDRHQVIRFDLPGHGLTGPHVEDDYRLEAYMKVLQSLLSKLGVKQCIIAGNSLGGEIAWRYALQNPQQVKGLILIGAAGYPVEIKRLPLFKLPLSYLWLRIPLLRELSVKFTSHRVIRNSLEFLYGDPEKVTDETVELYYDMTNREGNREALAYRMDDFGQPSPWEKIPSINAPALIIWGKQDRLIPHKNAMLFHRDLPNSCLTIFTEAGHMPMEEIPQESVKDVEEFIRTSFTEEMTATKNPEKHHFNMIPHYYHSYLFTEVNHSVLFSGMEKATSP